MKATIKKILNDRRLWVVSIVVFILLVTIFDKNNLIEAWRLNEEIQGLEEQKAYYQQRISADSLLLEHLKDDAFLERYARENYLMKRDKDMVYVMK